VTFPEVLLVRRTDEADPGVAVGDQVFDGGPHPAPVVWQRTGGVEALQVVAGQDDGLTLGPGCFEIAPLDGKGLDHDPVGVTPGDRGERRGREHPSAVVGGVPGLHDDDAAPRRGDLTDQAGQEFPVEEPTRVPGECEHGR